MPAKTTLLFLLAACVISCGGASEPAEDGIGDTFLHDGKADSGGVVEQSDGACAILKLANLADEHRLHDVVGVGRRASSAIAAWKRGDDGIAGTADDRWLMTLRQLDDISWVGPLTFFRLWVAAESDPQYRCGDQSVQVLAINDFHGNLKPPAGGSGRIQTGPDPAVDRVDAGGVEYLATHVKRLRAQNPNSVVVAAGDLIGATPLLASLFHDEPAIEAMNRIGLDISSVGNHEFDKGALELQRLAAFARFHYLAANVVRENGETLFPPYEVRTFGNARIAFIGMTLKRTPEIVTPSGVVGLQFRDEADTVNALVPMLRRLGVGTFVVLVHQGAVTTGLYNACDGLSGDLLSILPRLDPAVSVVVSAHTHAAYQCTIDGRIVTSAASYGRLITDIALTIDEKSGTVKAASANNVIVTRDVDKDAGETELIAQYDAQSAPLAHRVVGRVTGDIVALPSDSGEAPLGDIIADAMLEATHDSALGGAVVAFMNPGGVRTDLTSGQITGGEMPGEITYEEAFSVQPFGNNLVTVTLTGEQLHGLLEQQFTALPGGMEKHTVLQPSAGFNYIWDSTRPIGQRIDTMSIQINGATFDAQAGYRVTVNSFLAAGGDGFSLLRSATQPLGGVIDLDAFVTYLGAHSPLAPPALGRVTKR